MGTFVGAALLGLALLAPSLWTGPAADRPDDDHRTSDADPAPWLLGDECGSPVRKESGGHWHCTFVDNFNGSSLDREFWVPQTHKASGDPRGAHACFVDHPSVVSVGGGELRLSLRRSAETVTCSGLSPTRYVSGEVSTFYRFGQQYGRFEARMRTTATTEPGLHEAFWLWPDVRYGADRPHPASGEIDISETYSKFPNLTVPFLHYTGDDNGGPSVGLNTSHQCFARRGEWNTYTLIWEPSRIEILANGVSCLVNTSGDAAFQKPYILMFSQAMGFGSNAATNRTPIPATTEVDYVKVWR